MNNKCCVNCKSYNIKQVDITTRGSFKLIAKSDKFSIAPPSTNINKYVCLECGCVSL